MVHDALAQLLGAFVVLGLRWVCLLLCVASHENGSSIWPTLTTDGDHLLTDDQLEVLPLIREALGRSDATERVLVPCDPLPVHSVRRHVRAALEIVEGPGVRVKRNNICASSKHAFSLYMGETGVTSITSGCEATNLVR